MCNFHICRVSRVTGAPVNYEFIALQKADKYLLYHGHKGVVEEQIHTVPLCAKLAVIDAFTFLLSVGIPASQENKCPVGYGKVIAISFE